MAPPQGAIIWWSLEGEKATACLAQVPQDSIVELTTVNRPKNAPKPRITDPMKIPMLPSALLAAIVGPEPGSLTELFEDLLAYLDEQDLFDRDEDTILCDPQLKALTEVDRITLEDLGKAVRKNVTEYSAD